VSITKNTALNKKEGELHRGRRRANLRKTKGRYKTECIFRWVEAQKGYLASKSDVQATNDMTYKAEATRETEGIQK